MKKNILFIIVAFLSFSKTLCSQEVKEVVVSFNMNDFNLVYNEYNELIIETGTQPAIFKSDELAPGLPFVPVNILVPSNCAYSNAVPKFNKRLLMENVSITQNPKHVSTSSNDETLLRALQYSQVSYPTDNVEYVSTSVMDGYVILSFLVCPFEYDARNKKLYFIDSFTISINLVTSHDNFILQNKNENKNIIRSIIVNDDDLTLNQTKTTINNLENNDDQFDYIIITNSSLEESFVPLINWKKTKGLRAKIISTEYIENNYSGNTIQLKIKSCLYDYYKNHGLKYVLLGGDDAIVPVQKCFVDLIGSDNDNIPTDLFYGCFDGNFEWNENGNELIGEPSDNVNLAPSIFVTRAPLRTSEDVKAFVDKLIFYEKSPLEKGWGNNILMCGTKLWADYVNDKSMSDSEAKGENLYENFIAPYWKGDRKKFYDTHTDFTGDANYVLNSSNLQQQLGQGYTFVDMITHGDKTLWALEEGFYNSNSGALLENNGGSTIVSTNACLTNAFDFSEQGKNDVPCLSESLIRNPKSGVVAYLGCSREGWGYSGGTKSLGISLQYEAQFYKRLFSPEFVDKNYGIIVAAAKMSMIASCKYDGAARWVQFGLNPIGDPEMPIFDSYPKSFLNATIKQSENKINVNAGIPGCTVCVMSYDDRGDSYYEVKKDIQNVEFTGVNTKVSVCITKQGYIPKIEIINNKSVYIQNEIIVGPKQYDGNIIKIGSSVTQEKPNGSVTFNGGEIILKGRDITVENGTTINSNTDFQMYNK